MVFALLLLVVAQAVVSNNVSTIGVDLSELEAKKEVLRKENALLKEQLLMASSYTVIAEKVEKDGYVSVSKQMTFDPLPLAIR